ncbi:set domain-containing protein 5 [Colletotrichum sojae]|uniref:Set domain-containing protein 5 n=1 Tax=Colletotrichum sojae TaxID=2175907 RepID=A0A8H6J7V2_9PEZI|nr:set domain-containing protein 5 [Colletotrichum sojae]
MAKDTNTEDGGGGGHCYHCQKPTARQCGGCSGAPAYDLDSPAAQIFYCSSDCQRVDWTRHKKECQAMQTRKSLLRAATLLEAIMVRIRKNAYPINLTSIEHESDTTVTIAGSVAPTENGAGQSQFGQPLPTDLDVFRQHPELFKPVCLSGGGAEAFLYLCNVIKDMFLDTSPSITFTEVEVRPAKQKLHVSSAALDAACSAGGSSHQIYKIAMENGELWAMNVTAAQHGYSDASLLLPWSAYVKERSGSVDGEWRLGTHRNKPEDVWKNSHRNPPPVLAQAQALARELDSQFPILAAANGGSFPALLKTTAVRGTSGAPALNTTEPFCIKNAPGKGLGLFATVHIPKGTRILSEKPLFAIPRGRTLMETKRLVAREVHREVHRLDDMRRAAFYAMHNIHGDHYTSEIGIIKTNGAEAGVFLKACRINHSCRPNAQRIWNRDLDRLMVHVCRDIEEEAERARSDARLERIRQLNARFDGVTGILTTPLAYLRYAHEIEQLLKEEGIHDALGARLYDDAMQIPIANGDEARARVFAERAHVMRVIDEGRDSNEAARLKALIERPASHSLFGSSMQWKQPVTKIPRSLVGEVFEKWLWRL